MKNFVLALTFSRIGLAPLILIACIFEYYWYAFILFNLAALSDYFDGRFARKYSVESKFGSILDPIADKILLVFVIISVIDFSQEIVVPIMCAFILAREFWVSAIREIASSAQKSSATQVTFLAKSKTAMQFIALTMHLLGKASGFAMISFLANFVLLLAVLLAYKSAIIYTQNLLKLR